jgi:hypothetical protein
MMAIGLLSLLFIRWRRSKSKADIVPGKRGDSGISDFNSLELAERPEVATGLIKTNGSNGLSGSNGATSEGKAVVRLAVSVPTSLYGAFQVDQEVTKLVTGQPHRMEVLASRAPDDRRAIEASLLKGAFLR